MGVIGAVMVIRQLAESSTAFDMNRTVVSQHSTSGAGLSATRKRKASSSFSPTLATMHGMEMAMNKLLKRELSSSWFYISYNKDLVIKIIVKRCI